MKIIQPDFKILTPIPQHQVLGLLELAARTCYKSEDKIAQGSAEKLIKALIKSGHESVLEHVSISVKIICDRGVSHELVRHRLCSFSQESTRYANYSKEKFGQEITVIDPGFWQYDPELYGRWKNAMHYAEKRYLDLIARGATAQEARTVLPNSLKTEVITTANIREWRHIFALRSSMYNFASHPQMIQIMDRIRAEFMAVWPVCFGGDK